MSENADRYFQIKYNNSYSNCYQVKSGIRSTTRKCDEASTISNFTADMPTTNHTTITTYADDTVLPASINDPILASYLQHHLNLYSNGTRNGKSE
jgi:hypothetical protein